MHPDDERYRHLIEQKVWLPLANQEIPIIADSYVDREFGTGALKITPAHDPNDFEVGKRHDLPEIDVMTDDARINANGGSYEGLDRYDARKKIVEELTTLGASRPCGRPHACRGRMRPVQNGDRTACLDAMVLQDERPRRARDAGRSRRADRSGAREPEENSARLV